MRVFLGLLVVVFSSIVCDAKELSELPACQIAEKTRRQFVSTTINPFGRVIGIGDVHGSHEGLMIDLFNSNITTSLDTCEWREQPVSTLFVQMGDIVDRGGGAYGAWKCLRKLQSEAHLHNSKVIRLLGNHELWWLEGHLHMINKRADTNDIIQEMVNDMITDLQTGNLLGAFVHKIQDIPILFIHAGIGPNFYKYLKKQIPTDDFSVESIAEYVNAAVRSNAEKCHQYPCSFQGELFESGPDRGGRGIGGPFWTDFSIIEKGALKHPQYDFIQVVGHTMAHCYTHIGIHPTSSHAECSLGLIRPAAEMQAVCIDGGMYAGARAFLEIDTKGHFVAHQLNQEITPSPSVFQEAKKTLKWAVRDMTEETCGVVSDVVESEIEVSVGSIFGDEL